MMKCLRAAFALLALSCVPILPATAVPPAGRVIDAPAGFVTPSAVTFDDGTGKATPVKAAAPLPVYVPQNDVPITLALANTPASAKTIPARGRWALAQSCSVYGTVTFWQIGPDGTTPISIVVKTSIDVTEWPFAAGAVVYVTLSGTTGCNISLSRTM